MAYRYLRLGDSNIIIARVEIRYFVNTHTHTLVTSYWRFNEIALVRRVPLCRLRPKPEDYFDSCVNRRSVHENNVFVRYRSWKISICTSRYLFDFGSPFILGIYFYFFFPITIGRYVVAFRSNTRRNDNHQTLRLTRTIARKSRRAVWRTRFYTSFRQCSSSRIFFLNGARSPSVRFRRTATSRVKSVGVIITFRPLRISVSRIATRLGRYPRVLNVCNLRTTFSRARQNRLEPIVISSEWKWKKK